MVPQILGLYKKSRSFSISIYYYTSLQFSLGLFFIAHYIVNCILYIVIYYHWSIGLMKPFLPLVQSKCCSHIIIFSSSLVKKTWITNLKIILQFNRHNINTHMRYLTHIFILGWSWYPIIPFETPKSTGQISTWNNIIKWHGVA